MPLPCPGGSKSQEGAALTLITTTRSRFLQDLLSMVEERGIGSQSASSADTHSAQATQTYGSELQAPKSAAHSSDPSSPGTLLYPPDAAGDSDRTRPSSSTSNCMVISLEADISSDEEGQLPPYEHCPATPPSTPGAEVRVPRRLVHCEALRQQDADGGMYELYPVSIGTTSPGTVGEDTSASPPATSPHFPAEYTSFQYSTRLQSPELIPHPASANPAIEPALASPICLPARILSDSPNLLARWRHEKRSDADT